MTNTPPLSSCYPRWATKRDETRQTLGHGICNAAKLLGTPLLPWQEQVAMVAGELLDDGTPAYRRVIYSTPRQSGKSTLILAWLVHRAVAWTERSGHPQRIRYSAQTGNDARKKLLEDFVPPLERCRRAVGLDRVYKSNGNEQVAFTNGSRVDLLASLADSGHGFTLDGGIQDELFADTDFRRDQSMGPAMATKPYGQLMICSTMGTPDSMAWNAAVAQGRASAEQQKQSGIAYFEWSARLDDDPADPATWWSCMPALGRTIMLPTVEVEWAAAQSQGSIGEFMRAWLNIPTVAAEQVIPALVWDLVQTNTLQADPPGVMALDVDPDRTVGAITAAKTGDRPVIEVVDYRAGTGWLVDRAIGLHDKYGAPFVVDATGPAAGLVPELERAGVPVTTVAGREVTNACGRFYDRVVNETVWIRKHGELDHAVAGAVKSVTGDSWRWGRKSSRVDISLLMAATLALWQVDMAGRPDPALNVW